jgi:hypothetical protein
LHPYYLVPERAGNRGVGNLRKPWFIPPPQKYAELEKTLNSQHGIISENDQAIAKLWRGEQTSDKGRLVISKAK